MSIISKVYIISSIIIFTNGVLLCQSFSNNVSTQLLGIKKRTTLPHVIGQKTLKKYNSHPILGSSCLSGPSLCCLSSSLCLSGPRFVSSQPIIKELLETLFSNIGPVPILPSFVLNLSLFVLLQSKLRKVLTPEGYFHSLGLGTMLWHTIGWKGWSTCVLYLFLGSSVTKIKFEEKEKMGIAEGRGGRRGPENVWGSAATALICAYLSVQLGNISTSSGVMRLLGTVFSPNLFILAYVASLATKLADTFASEIGKAYGKTTFLITTLEKSEPGTEGAVSLEGTAAAAFGGSLLPMYAYAIGLLQGPCFTCIGITTLAAFVATNVESVVGATLQGKKGMEWMTNEVVNLLNTIIGAVIAIILGKKFL